MDKDLPVKQKTASSNEWFILKMGKGAEQYPAGKCIGTGLACYVNQ